MTFQLKPSIHPKADTRVKIWESLKLIGFILSRTKNEKSCATALNWCREISLDPGKRLTCWGHNRISHQNYYISSLGGHECEPNGFFWDISVWNKVVGLVEQHCHSSHATKMAKITSLQQTNEPRNERHVTVWQDFGYISSHWIDKDKYCILHTFTN